MEDYSNISRIEKLDDGTMNILMKNGRRAYVEIRRLEAAFIARIFWLREGEHASGKTPIKELSLDGALAECARSAIGWVDENHLIVEEAEEMKQNDKIK